MELNLDNARELFHAGQFASIAHKVAGASSATLRKLSPAHRSLLAHVLFYTGKPSLATELAQSISNTDSLSCQSEAHLVLGLARRREGRIEEASAELQNAMRLGKEAGDRRMVGWAHAHLFRALSDGLTDVHLTPLLTDVRRSMANAGDPQLAVFLHDSVATTEAQRGRPAEAARHLRVAQNLLKLTPNAWLEQLVAINWSCVAILDCDQVGYAQHAKTARALAEITGHANSNAAMDTNDAHFSLVRGDFGDASMMLEKILSRPSSVQIELAALEGVARIQLAEGLLDDCETTLERIDRICNTGLQMAYTARGASRIRVRLLMRRGSWHEAASLAGSQLSEFAALSDSGTTVALRALRALALAQCGRTGECSDYLMDALISPAAALREHEADLCMASSLVLRTSGWQTLAATLAERSNRVWKAQGNKYGPVESSGLARGVTGSASAIPEPKSPKHSDSASCAVNSLAAAVELGHSPGLLGDELLSCIRALQITTPTSLENASATAKAMARPGTRSLDLGEYQGKQRFLVCAPPRDPHEAVLLAGIFRLGQAALELERAREEDRNRAALWPADPIETQDDAIFLAEEMQNILKLVRRIAPTNVPILITGETGTGKEVLARTIHALSNRAAAIFLPFNCTSAPKDMLDSQLFGHRRGAFTGAVESFPGVVRAAAGGTLFLDEIGDTSLDVQPKLLRFLESNEIHPIGDAHPARVDVRLILATNADLDALVGQGRFREDLYYRLSIVRLHLPPLRERRVEIPILAQHYLRKYAREYEKADLRLAEETMDYLMAYRWPGNTRQLANEMRRMAAVAESSAVVMPEHLPQEIAAARRTIPASQRLLDPTEVVVRLDQPMAAAVQHLEQTMVQYALRQCGGRIEETAAMLGLSRKGLYLKRQRFGIDPPQPALAAGA